MTPEEQKRLEDEALLDFGRRWVAACLCFEQTDLLPWEKTVKGMAYFDKLPLDHLHTQLRRKVERAFVRMNTITSRYPIQTWDDYRLISNDDHSRLQAIVKKI